MNVKRGLRNPLLLSTMQTYLFSGVVFACNVGVLIAVLLGVSKNEEALADVARAAEHWTAAKPVEPPRKEETLPRKPSATERSLQISAPEEWQWRGCRALDSGGIEVSFTPRL